MTIKRFYWYFRFSKWIFKLNRLEYLVQVLENFERAPGRGSYSMHPIPEFCNLARSVLNHGKHDSWYILQQLKELLQEISNMGGQNHFPIRRFLGRQYPTIGGSFLFSWSSAQMFHFMLQVLSWKGDTKRLYRFEFDESTLQHGMNADDIRHHGANLGPIFRERIMQTWQNGGCLVTHLTALNEAKTAALTPRGERRQSLSSSSSFVGTSMPIPMSSVETPRTIYGSNLSLTSIPPTSPRQICEADGYLTRAPTTSRNEPKDRFFLLTSLLSENFSCFLRDAYDLSRLNREGNLWFLHDRLVWFKGTYGNSILFNAILQDSFFDALYRSKIVKDALTIFLAESPDEYSFDILRQRPLSKQEEFFEILKMVIMHELWLIQNQSELTTKVFMYKCKNGAWKQDPETFDFVLVPHTMAEMVRTA